MTVNRKNDVMADEVALEGLEAVLFVLNADDGPKTPQAERIETLFSLLGKLGTETPDRERMQILLRVRKILARYRWTNSIAPTTEGLQVLYEVADRGQLSAADKWEQDAVRDLLTALPRLSFGDRLLIRRCENPTCRRWFLAGRKDKRTCYGPGSGKSDACKQWLHDNKSPEQKEYKAAYMRQARKDAKEREERERERQNKQASYSKGKRRVVRKASGKPAH